VERAGLFTDEWLRACNEALAATPPPDAAALRLVVTERVLGAPQGANGTVTLVADADGVRLVAGEVDGATAWLTLSMDDAEALHAGSIGPARALAEGRVRVRGDLRAVVEAVGFLAAAHGSLRRTTLRTDGDEPGR
jgi:hypothetical protein